jgi:hypothetical protein
MGWEEEPKSYDGENAWSSIDHSILFDSVFRIDVYHIFKVSLHLLFRYNTLKPLIEKNNTKPKLQAFR